MTGALALGVSRLVVLAASGEDGKANIDPNTVSPGLIGFLATFGIVVVTVLLVIDMNRRVRRLRFRERAADAQRRQARADVDGPDDDSSGPSQG
ncbi:MAG: hypothetical protein ACK5MT_16255 [Actinomycetales bacterium]